MASRRQSATFEQALERLEEHGLLLLQDKTLPSLVGLIAGEPVSGSWWGHPRAHADCGGNGKLPWPSG